MPTIRERPNGTFELRVVHRTLPKPYYATLTTRDQAEGYATKLVQMLDRGEVPPELKPAEARPQTKLSVVIRDYIRLPSLADSDRAMVAWLQSNVNVAMEDITVRWTDEWVLSMKRKDHLAPGTIRKKVESLARVLDWWLRKTYDGKEERAPMNPLRSLPVGYSRYGEGEAPEGKEAKVDESRDRRLAPEEEARIESALTRVRADDRHRVFNAREQGDHFLLLYRLIVNTGLRLREAYTLKTDNVRFPLRTLHIPRSKTGKARDVPMTPQVYTWLDEAKETFGEEYVFPWCVGENPDLLKITNRLASRFRSLFRYANVPDFTEHDLRHEATCRWMLMKDKNGRWLFRPEEVRRITGHKNVQQFERYLSLRGSDLAERFEVD